MKDLESVSLINQNNAQELIEMLEEDALEIFDVFIKDTPLLVEQLLAKGADKEQLLLASHSLKSSAAYVGAERLSVLSNEIEEYIRQDETEKARDLLPNISKILSETFTQLRIVMDEINI